MRDEKLIPFSIVSYPRRRITTVLTASAVVLALTFAWPALGADLAVTTGAARSGSHGLEVTVGSPCTSDDDVVLADETVTGTLTVEGCRSVVTGDNVAVASSGDLTITAGSTITLQSGFSVASGGRLAMGIDPSLPRFAYVEDDTPDTEIGYRAEFYLNLDALTLDPADELHNFVGYSAGGEAQLRVVLGHGPVVALEVRDDTGSYHSTPGIAVPSGWTKVDVQWLASSLATASLAVNDGVPADLTGFDTDGCRIDLVRWGLVGGDAPGATGTFDQDDFDSTR
jgi:hypothetical protein